ncbi:hypothetical protein Tco_0754103 [Tanacetum coccineum]
MGDENPIRTLGDYSKPTRKAVLEYHRAPRREQRGTSSIRHHPVGAKRYAHSIDLRAEDPNQNPHRISKNSRNGLERLPPGSITTWEDLTTRFLAQFFPP